jgi:hypothetical protein
MSLQKGEEALERFQDWKNGKSLSYFREIANRERTQLTRTVIMQECQIDRSAIRQNSGIASSLKELEQSLRDQGVLIDPGQPPKNTDGSTALPLREKGQQRSILDAEHLSKLEKIVAAQNAELESLRPLRDENIKLKKKLSQSMERESRYSVLDSVLSETGRLPR